MSFNYNRTDSGKVVLLDLNYTLVSNSQWIRNNGGDSIRQEHERYRNWLIDAIEATGPRAVVLITVRPESWRDRTLEMIRDRCRGWQPDECCFATFKTDPPSWKNYAMTKIIEPKYGSDPDTYFAYESNLDTWKKTYNPRGIKGFKVFPHTEDLKDKPSRAELTGQKELF